MARDYYQGDPYWITLKYPGKCGACGKDLPRGARAFYFPKGRKGQQIFGSAEACCGAGNHESERFTEAAELEYAYNHGMA